MATEDPRGTKRTCQNGQCGERFYDLNRDPIICPICGSDYVIASAPPRREETPAEKPAPVKVEKTETADSDEEADVISLEEADAEVGDDDDDDTFLEENDDDNDDVGIIAADDDEEDT